MGRLPGASSSGRRRSRLHLACNTKAVIALLPRGRCGIYGTACRTRSSSMADLRRRRRRLPSSKCSRNGSTPPPHGSRCSAGRRRRSHVAFDLSLALGDEALIQSPLRPSAGPPPRSRTAPSEIPRRPDDDGSRSRHQVVREVRAPGSMGSSPNPCPLFCSGPAPARCSRSKHRRTATCRPRRYRLHKNSTAADPLLGSLLPRALRRRWALQHISVSASPSPRPGGARCWRLRPLETDIEDHPWGQLDRLDDRQPDRVPGTGSRWSARKDLSFVPLRPQRVLEVG